MKKLSLQPIPQNALRNRHGRAYLKDYTNDWKGRYVVLDRNWKKPVVGQIIDSYTYMEQGEANNVYRTERYFMSYYKVYLVNRREMKVLML